MTNCSLIDSRLGLDVDEEEEAAPAVAEEATPTEAEGAATSAMEEID
jgi:hypothetical protein